MEWNSKGYFFAIFNRASKARTLDIMVRKQARDLNIQYDGGRHYADYALEFELVNPEAFAMFYAANERLNKIREKTSALLCPSDLFE